MNETILPADKFIVINKSILTNYDKKILYNLYQPIIGGMAVSLYLTLFSYLDKTEIFSLEWSHHNLMTDTQYSLDDIISLRERLEGIGLLKTYYKKSSINNYIYELYSPLNAYEFFNNPLLSTIYLSNVGKNKFDKMIDYYKLPNFNLQEYENITKTFNDVFSILSNPNLEIYDNLRSINKNKIMISTNNNINEILSMIPEDLLNIRTMTKDIQDTIMNLSYIYNFSNEEMQNIIIDSIDETKKIDIEKLKINCQKFYKFETGGSLPTIIYRNQPEYLKKNVTSLSKKAQTIYQFENMSPYEYLLSKNDGKKPSKSEMNLLVYLLEELKMMPGVVNVLLDYVLRINDSKLNKNFVEAIASQWIKKNIKTVEDAMNLAEKEHKNKVKIVENKTKVKKETIKPDWMQKDISLSVASKEEQEEIEKILSEYK